jgi:hypothetical protein
VSRTKINPVDFFYEWGGYSYDPKTETPEQGKRRCAKEAAKAEAWAQAERIRFSWGHETDPDYSGIKHKGPLWVCVAYQDDDVIGSLGNIDLGKDGTPWSDNYGRVVEADLALEAMPEDA